MDNVLKFLIKLQAQDGNVTRATQQVMRQLDTIQRKADSVGAKLRQAFSIENFKSQLTSLPGMEFLMNPYTIIGAGIGAITKLGAQAEMTSTAFRVLVGDEQKAAAVLKDINDFAAATPFTKLDLEGAAQTMLNFGVKSDDVMGKLRQLGDISMGDSQKLGSLALVFGQVSAATKMSGQDLMQFINAGFNPLKELSAMTGKSYEELQDVMSKGGIKTEDVAAAIAHATQEGGQFHGMMDATAQTLSGKWSTAVGQIQQQAVSIFEKIEPAILAAVDLFSVLADGVMGVVNFFVEWSDVIGIVGGTIGAFALVLNTAKIATAAYGLVTQGVTLATQAWTAAQAVLNAVMSANPFVLVAAVIAALTVAVVACWNKFAGFRAFIKTMWDTIKGFGGIIKDYLIDRIKTFMSGIGKLGAALAKLFDGDFKGAWASAVDGVKDLTGITSAEKAMDATKKLADGVAGNYAKHKAEEDAKQEAKEKPSGGNALSKPGLKGSTYTLSGGGADSGNGSGKGGKGGKGGAGKTAEALATGGTRNTQITVNIGKLIETMQVTMADKTDTGELERMVLQSINRSLAIATSTDR